MYIKTLLDYLYRPEEHKSHVNLFIEFDPLVNKLSTLWYVCTASFKGRNASHFQYLLEYTSGLDENVN